MSAEKNNQLYWLNYAQAIKDQAGANLGSTGVFLLGTKAQKGPPAGDDIPDEYTYQGLFDIGNNLLPTDNLFYNPSTSHGYDEALETFLNWVDTGAAPDQAITTAINRLLKDQAAAQAFLKIQREAAKTQFNEETAMGLTAGQDFYDWLQSGKAPGYNAAQRDLDDIGQQIEQLQSRQAGPMTGPLKRDKANLAKGHDELRDIPGYNMRGAMGDILSAEEIQRRLKSGQKLDPPVFVRLPAFNAPRYKALVQRAMTKLGNAGFVPSNSIDVKLDFGKSTSDYNFGQTNMSADMSYGGWFSFEASASHESTSETLNTFDESSEVTIKIIYDEFERVPITPGQWDADVSKYKLRSDAPKECRTLAKVTDLVVVTWLGYEITVGTKTAKLLDTKLNEKTTARAGIRLFGVPIGIRGSIETSNEHKTHEASWDNATKTLKILPKPDIGFATIVGIAGEKFTLAN